MDGLLSDLRGCWPTAWRMFRRHLAQQYRYSSLGVIWAFAPTALVAVVLIGTQRARVVGDAVGVPAAFYGVFGIAMAQTFLEGVNATRRLFSGNAPLLRRQNRPIEGLVVSSLLDIGFSMGVRIAVVAVLFIVFSVKPVPGTVTFAAVGFCGIALAGAGIGLLLAPLSSLKRDVENLLALLPWTIFAVTPVFAPVAPDSGFGHACRLNPLTVLFDGVRTAAYGGGGGMTTSLWGVLVGLVLVACGWGFCRTARPHVIERMLV